ncbi:MAG: hypothetical protein Q9170_005606 [Blastenia crenularia]
MSLKRAYHALGYHLSRPGQPGFTNVATTIGTITTATLKNTLYTTETTTSTSSTVTVLSPAGFTPVRQANGYVPKIKGRDVVPRAATAKSVVRYSIAKGVTTQVASPAYDDNRATNVNGGYTISGVGIDGHNYQVPANSDYECCAACQASNCKTSSYFSAAYPAPVRFDFYLDTCRPGRVTDYFYTYSGQ